MKEIERFFDDAKNHMSTEMGERLYDEFGGNSLLKYKSIHSKSKSRKPLIDIRR